MNRDQAYHLLATYSQITPPKPEPSHMTPVHDEDSLWLMGQNVVRFTSYAPKCMLLFVGYGI